MKNSTLKKKENHQAEHYPKTWQSQKIESSFFNDQTQKKKHSKNWRIFMGSQFSFFSFWREKKKREKTITWILDTDFLSLNALSLWKNQQKVTASRNWILGSELAIIRNYSNQEQKMEDNMAEKKSKFWKTPELRNSVL